MQLIRDKAESDRAVQDDRIRRLEELVAMQNVQNQKLQSLLDSQLRQVPQAPIVETATEVLAPASKMALCAQTAKAAPTIPKAEPSVPPSSRKVASAT